MADSFLRPAVSTMRSGIAGALIAVLALAAAPTIASAQTAAPATKPAAKPAPATKPAPAEPAKDAAAPEDPLPWIKICSKDADKKNVCLVAKELRSQEGQLVASVALRDIEGDSKKVLLIAVPPVVLIQPGMRVQIDKGKQLEAKYTICFPNACYAEMEIADQAIAEMKKGKALVVTSLNIQQKPMAFPFLLSTFKKAAEGEGIDPNAGQQNQEQLQQELQKRAEEAAKKLQGGDAAKPADAPATPAPAPAPAEAPKP
ncbi:MAG: invasion associated locus B family protein [Phyllobacteriaceae bacterium]|nr:invasion associated locus B family protein [Phyllobacteriaceae bacterium]